MLRRLSDDARWKKSQTVSPEPRRAKLRSEHALPSATSRSSCENG